MSVQHWLPLCWHRWVFYLGCDPAGAVALQEGQNHKVHCFNTCNWYRHTAWDDIGCYTQGILESMLLKLGCNAWSWHLLREICIIPALGAGIVFRGGRLEPLREYLIQHLSVCLPSLIQPHLRNIAVLDWNRQESDHYDTVPWGHLADLRRYIANCYIYRPLCQVACKVWEMCPVGQEDQRKQCVRHSECWLSVNLHIIILKYLSLPESATTSPQCVFHYRGVSVHQQK